MTPAQIQMLCDAIDQGGRILLFALLILAGGVMTSVTIALFVALAIRATGRYIVRRMSRGSL